MERRALPPRPPTPTSPPDRDRDTTVFRILQESLTNVVRQAHAESVDIRCGVVGGALVLEVVETDSRHTSSAGATGALHGPAAGFRPGTRSSRRGDR